MLHHLLSLLHTGLLLATPSAAKALPPGGTPPTLAVTTIRRRVEEVRVSFSVEDGHKLLKNLSPDQFTFYDDKHAVTSVTAFAPSSDSPLRVGLLVDRSDSVSKAFTAEQEAARQFLGNVLRPGTDSVFLQDFTYRWNFRQAEPGGIAEISAGVSALAAGGQTALYDALYAATQFEGMTAETSEPVRRVIILLSDGEDTCSRHGMDDAIQAMQQADVSIYAITIHSSRRFVPGDAVLQKLAEATGGRAFVLSGVKGLGPVFAQIQDDLRSQYAVAFRRPSAETCGYHTVTVEPRNAKLRVRARQGYYACGH